MPRSEEQLAEVQTLQKLSQKLPDKHFHEPLLQFVSPAHFNQKVNPGPAGHKASAFIEVYCTFRRRSLHVVEKLQFSH